LPVSGCWRRHGGTVASSLEELEKIVERVLIEGGNHRLCDIRKEVIDAEARAGKWIHPIAFEQAADDEPYKKVHQIARVNGLGMKAKRHALRVPVHDHADEHKKGDAGQLRQSKLRERTTVLRR